MPSSGLFSARFVYFRPDSTGGRHVGAMPPCDDCGRRLCLGNCPRRAKERSATSTAGIVKPTLAAQTTAESEASVPADVPSRPVHPRDFGMLSWHEHRTGRPHPDEFTHGSPISPAVVVQRDADGNLRHVDIYLEDGSPPRYPPGFAPGDLDQYGPSFQVSRRRVRVGRPVLYRRAGPSRTGLTRCTPSSPR